NFLLKWESTNHTNNVTYQARQAAQKSLEKHYNTSHNKVIEQITSQLVVMNQEQLVTVCQMLSEFSNNKSITDKEPEKHID
ncbi:32090_t:CDS:1, partial [Racocetra persica]